MKMVAAQRARRVLDRLVGYKISPLLWDKVRRGLSAGRVQSVALKLVCDREREIEAFVPEEYWNIFARLAGPQPPEFDAKLLKKSGDADQGRQRGAVEGGPRRPRAAPTWIVSSVTTKERKRHAPPPFITSKLQQTARFPVKKTMMLAQQLYEGGIEIPGLDGRSASSPTCAPTRSACRTTRWPRCASTSRPRSATTTCPRSRTSTRRSPTRRTRTRRSGRRRCSTIPKRCRPYLTPDQYSLYRLIWNRFVASQMPPATFDETTVDVTAGDYLFRVKGTVPKFAGWMATYGLTPGESEQKEPTPKQTDGDDDEDGVSGVLPPLAEGDRLELKALRPEQKFTQPPPRFSEATLVKELEENGIGRPSTYASIIGVLQDREYVNKIEGRFKPTALGVMITRPAHQELRRHHRRRVHAQPRGRPRQDRAGQDRLRQDARRASTRSSRRTSRAPARR